LNRLMHILLVFYVTSRLEKSLCQYFCFKNTQNDCVSSVLKKRWNCSLRRIMDSISHKRISPPTPHTDDALAMLSLPKIHTPCPLPVPRIQLLFCGSPLSASYSSRLLVTFLRAMIGLNFIKHNRYFEVLILAQPKIQLRIMQQARTN
jgi:hypothetical protein